MYQNSSSIGERIGSAALCVPETDYGIDRKDNRAAVERKQHYAVDVSCLQPIPRRAVLPIDAALNVFHSQILVEGARDDRDSKAGPHANHPAICDVLAWRHMKDFAGKRERNRQGGTAQLNICLCIVAEHTHDLLLPIKCCKSFGGRKHLEVAFIGALWHGGMIAKSWTTRIGAGMGYGNGPVFCAHQESVALLGRNMFSG